MTRLGSPISNTGLPSQQSLGRPPSTRFMDGPVLAQVYGGSSMMGGSSRESSQVVLP
jgi:hypothetical protein